MMRHFSSVSRKRIRPVVISVCVLFTLIVGFTQSSAAAAPKRRRYVPVYAASVKMTEQARRGTLKGDFSWAAASETVRAAADRWKIFLARHAGPNKEYEDGFDTLRVEVAKYELMRVYYLLGNVKAGDKLLSELDPLKLKTE